MIAGYNSVIDHSKVADTGEAKSRGWVVGRGSCLFEDKKKIHMSSLSARSKFVLGLRSCLFGEFPVVH